MPRREAVQIARLLARIAELEAEVAALKLAKAHVQITALKLIIAKLAPKAAEAKYLRGILEHDSLIPGEAGPGAKR